jgi:DDE family transposase
MIIESFVDLCTAVYALVDDRYRLVVAPYDRRPGPEGACSESEVITLSLVAELIGMDEESRFLAYVRRNHPALFPRLPSLSRYNRRRRRLVEATNRIRLALARDVLLHSSPEGRDLAIIDSLPVPVVGFAHARGAHRWYGEARYGRNAAKGQTFYGYKLHLLASASGLVLDFALVPANLTDGTLAEQLLIGQRDLTVLGDKAYIDAALQALLARRNHVHLLTPARANQRPPQGGRLPGLIAHFRQAIETLNSQLAEQFAVERNRAKSVPGLCARIQAKLTAHTIGLLLNCLCGRPLRSLKALALI